MVALPRLLGILKFLGNLLNLNHGVWSSTVCLQAPPLTSNVQPGKSPTLGPGPTNKAHIIHHLTSTHSSSDREDLSIDRIRLCVKCMYGVYRPTFRSALSPDCTLWAPNIPNPLTVMAPACCGLGTKTDSLRSASKMSEDLVAQQLRVGYPAKENQISNIMIYNIISYYMI